MKRHAEQTKRQIADDFIKRINPYKKPMPINFDLRGYAAYAADNKLKANEITPEIMQMFSKSKV